MQTRTHLVVLLHFQPIAEPKLFGGAGRSWFMTSRLESWPGWAEESNVSVDANSYRRCPAGASLNQAAARQELRGGSRQGFGGCPKLAAVIGVG